MRRARARLYVVRCFIIRDAPRHVSTLCCVSLSETRQGTSLHCVVFHYPRRAMARLYVVCCFIIRDAPRHVSTLCCVSLSETRHGTSLRCVLFHYPRRAMARLYVVCCFIIRDAWPCVSTHSPLSPHVPHVPFHPLYPFTYRSIFSIQCIAALMVGILWMMNSSLPFTSFNCISGWLACRNPNTLPNSSD